MDKKGVQRVV